MKTERLQSKQKTGFDVQTIVIRAPYDRVFRYIADPQTLPEWTHAFKNVSKRHATMETPDGSVDIGLEVRASQENGTIDWFMEFPDGSEGSAYSRLIPDGVDRCIYSFVLMAPPVPQEQIEGTLERQKAILRSELAKLKAILQKSSE